MSVNDSMARVLFATCCVAGVVVFGILLTSISNSTLAQTPDGVPSIDELEKQLKAQKAKSIKAPQRLEPRKTEVAKTPPILVGIQADMITIQTGSFEMGSDGKSSDEKPKHTVSVRAFRLSAHEVTFDQYDAFADATSRPRPDDRSWGRGSQPVFNVNWDDAQAFIGWLNLMSGRKFRLPSEAEWEYAARAGTTTNYPWGDTYDPTRARGKPLYAKAEDLKPQAVGSFRPNLWGLYDVIGNVAEWTQDCGHDDYAGAPSDASAWVTGDCSWRQIRGGSWYDNDSTLRVSFRNRIKALVRSDMVGLRLAEDF